MSGNITQLNEDLIKNNLKDLVRTYRSGHYDRNFTTTSGDITLRILFVPSYFFGKT